MRGQYEEDNSEPYCGRYCDVFLAYLWFENSWILADLIAISLPGLLGIDLLAMMGEDLYYTWIVYFEYIGIWICGLIIFAVIRGYRPMLQAFSPKRKGNNVKFALAGGLSLGMGLNLFIALVAIVTGAIEIHFVGMGAGAFVLLFLAVFIQSGAEELVARVYIYQRLRKDFPKWPIIAILGNALFFFLTHIGNPGMTVISTLVLISAGVFYSLMVYYFDSLWVPILAHTTWNFTQSIILGLPNSGLVFPVSMFKVDAATSNFAFDPFFGIEGSILTLALNLAVCAGLYYLGRKKGAAETNIWKES